ncbi:MAG: hypothetical protein HN576_14000 [Bacteriovoracaceae bacterium]|nr:hypothetical protein [Bacteriovoracaceae bacterium]
MKEKNVVKVAGSSLFKPIVMLFKALESKFEIRLKFFIKNFFKTKFMMAMSKKIQMHGIEKVFLMGPKAFFYFFMFYLIRDTIIYIILPIYFARITGE